MAIRKQCLQLLRRLDRDGKLLPMTAICSACATTHERSWFSHDSLKLPNSRRECKDYTREVWICPHQSLCHAYVNPDHYGPFSNLSNSDPRQRFLFFPPVPTNSCNTCRSVFRGSWSSVIEYAILNITATSDLSGPNVEKALPKFRASICPHLRLSDSCVTDLYSLKCTYLEPSTRSATHGTCCCRACVTSNQCRSCNTNVYFEVEGPSSGESILRAKIIRHFGGYGPTSPQSRSQVVRKF